MALDKTTLTNAIKQAFLDELGVGATTQQQASVNRLATKIAGAIDGYVKGATVNPGIPVSTTGTAAAQTGATTGPGTLS